MTNREIAILYLVAASAVLAFVAWGKPPEGTDPDSSTAQWYQTLRQPGSGISCCSIADCRETDYRTDGDSYEALIGKDWIPVPPDKVLDHEPNPTGRAVVCWTPARGIMCFVRPGDF